MATMKRRVIYVGDGEWHDWQAVAKGDGISVSELIRNAMLEDTYEDAPLRSMDDVRQAARDAMAELRAESHGFRPAPKPSQKGK